MEFNSLKNFSTASCKEHACQVSLNLAKQFWWRSCLNEKVKAHYARMDDGQHSVTKAHLAIL